MDKKLNRQILYNKASGISATVSKPDKKESPKKPIAPILKPNSAASVALWIKSHELFKWSTMCEKLGIDSANFWRGIKTDKPVISEKHLPQIIQILKLYGYAE